MTGVFENNVQVQTDLLLNSLVPAQLFVRGQNLTSANPTYYAVTLTRGMNVALQSVVNGQATTLASVASNSYISGDWMRVSLVVQGDRLSIQVFRTATAQYLSSQGDWRAAPMSVIDLHDSSIISAGRVGIARPASLPGQVALDNFEVSTYPPAPAATTVDEEQFNGNLTRGIPSGWASYTNIQGETFQVSSSNPSLTGSNVIGVTGDPGLVARAWYNSSLPTNVQVSSGLLLNSLMPSQLFARGQNLDTDSPDYYAVSMTRGATIQLLRVVAGRSVILGNITTNDWLSQEWVQATLSVTGSTLQVQIYRPATGQYLTSNGLWQVQPTWAIVETDTAIRGSGKAGIGRASGYSGSVSFDNFLIATTPPVSGTTTPPPATNHTRTYHFENSAIGSLPSDWSRWSSGNFGAFQVSSQSYSSTSNGLASIGGSDAVARAWLNSQTYRDVQVSGSVLIDNLTPAQLFVRGQNVASSTPTYYAVSIARGLNVQLIKVVNGSTTVLSSLGSANYLSNLWLTVTLRDVANTLQVLVYRPDTGLYLTPNGNWQKSPIAAITLSDGTLTAAGYAGVSRPSSYNGRVLFDDITFVDLTENVPPTTGDGSSNTGSTSSSGGTTTSSGGTTTATGIQHYPYIRIAELAYYGTPIGDFETHLLKNSVDLVVSNPVYLKQIDTASPNTAQLIYSNVSNIYRELLTDWMSYANKNGFAPESAFYHVNVATPFSGDSSSSLSVNWFWSVQTGSAASGWADFATAAHQNAQNFSFPASGQSVVLGYPEQFREINVALLHGASGGWAGTLEYPSAVDAAGNPTAWSALTTLSNTTNGLSRSGQILFDPPSSWKMASINGSDPLYFVRVRTIHDGTAPVVSSILGRDYVKANGATTGIIPVFDYSADVNHDGYLTNAEYAKRKPGMDARFAYESRLFYPSYGQQRFATNPSNPAFRAWAVDYSARYLNANPIADGLFMDNSPGKLQVDPSILRESIANYSTDYGSMLAAINAKIAPRWILANTAGGGASTNSMIQDGVAYLEEFALRPLAASTTQFEDTAALVAGRLALSGGKGTAILDIYPQGGAPTDARTQIASLAYYYLLADSKHTYALFNGGLEPSTTWSRHWTDAIKYNVGQPQGAWSVFATGSDPANRNLTYKVYQRQYQNALILYKPLSYAQGVGTGTLADYTATTQNLGGSYRMLQADGTLSAPVTKITLRNGEGAILVKA